MEAQYIRTIYFSQCSKPAGRDTFHSHCALLRDEMITSCLSGARRVQELARSRGLRERNRPVLTPPPGMFTRCRTSGTRKRVILYSGVDAAHRWWGESDPLLCHTWQRGDRRRAVVSWHKAIADCVDSRKY